MDKNITNQKNQTSGDNANLKKRRRRHKPHRHHPKKEQNAEKVPSSKAKEFPQQSDSEKNEAEIITKEENIVNEESMFSIPIQFPDGNSAIKDEEKVAVVGIRFRPVGKTYTFDPDQYSMKIGDCVIVETSQGIEFGTVSVANHYASKKDLVLPLKKVLRFADENDMKKHEENRKLELTARKTFQDKVLEHKLDMALSDVECSFDHSKLIFYFTSEGRVDFREFVKDLASVFKTRIELRQIGVRDEAKQLGGLGICGRPLCCSSFLEDFQQVSIKMAKEQNLSLNPTKISGTCGRLMCCLRYENDVYVEAAKTCPRADAAVMTPQGKGIVVESNLLCGKCKVRLESDPENVVPYLARELKVIPKQKKTVPDNKEKNKNEAKTDENQ